MQTFISLSDANMSTGDVPKKWPARYVRLKGHKWHRIRRRIAAKKKKSDLNFKCLFFRGFFFGVWLALFEANDIIPKTITFFFGFVYKFNIWIRVHCRSFPFFLVTETNLFVLYLDKWSSPRVVMYEHLRCDAIENNSIQWLENK